jgi:hypothetical protein
MKAVAVTIAADQAQELRPARINSPGSIAPRNGSSAMKISGNARLLIYKVK